MTGDRDYLRARAHEQADDDQDWEPHLAPGRVTATAGLRSSSSPPIISRLIEAASTSAGVALPDAIRGKFEASLGTDLSGVRVHTGRASHDATRAVNAKAYSLGQSIHFAPRYDPMAPANEHLLAHEVAHTVQQRSGSAHSHIQRTPDEYDDGNGEYTGPDDGKEHWDKRYGNNHTDGIQDADYIKKHNGEKDAKGKGYAKMAPASEQPNAGVKLPTIALTPDDITRIYTQAAAADPADATEIQTMIGAGQASLGTMNKAFETMEIDTIQSQALFLAHQAGETSGGQNLVEKGAQKRPYAPFIGRGPLQVTNKAAYVRALAYIDTRSEQIGKEIAEKSKKKDELDKMDKPTDEQKKDLESVTAAIEKLTKQKAELDECSKACKGDIRKAADSKYAALFSAASMHASGGVESSGKVGATTTFDGRGPDEDFESGGNQQVDLDDKTGTTKKSYTFEEYRALEQKHGKGTGDMDSAIARGKIKQAVYAAAYAVLKAKVDAAKKAQQGQTP